MKDENTKNNADDDMKEKIRVLLETCPAKKTRTNTINVNKETQEKKENAFILGKKMETMNEQEKKLQMIEREIDSWK